MAKNKKRRSGGGSGGKKKTQQQRKGQPRPAASPPAPAPAASSPALWGVGLALLLLSVAASLMLVLQSLGNLSLPGCGPASACGRATSSVWGSVPGLGWPLSHVGLAYFLGIAAAWIVSGGRLPAALRWIVRLSAVGSIGLIIVMIVGGYLCPYCLAVHLANLAFVGLLELKFTGQPMRPALRPIGALVGVFVIATGILAAVQTREAQAVEERDEDALSQSTDAIIEGGGEDAGFTGRYHYGPEAAPVRVVIISDYQCPDCKNVESELRQILATRDDVSFSAKHFPFCTECNWKAREHNMNPHPNACWAARAAEAAGILGGDEGFWKMHHWLFDRSGSFTQAELQQALPTLGFDYTTFVETMGSPETLARVEADINQAVELGLRQTPMVFINGVELTGWRARNALTRAVDRVAATNPPPLTADADRPPSALQKGVNDWLAQPKRTLPSDGSGWAWGPEDPAVDIVVWGDHLEPFSIELDRRLRAVAESAPDVRYAFRPYPFDKACNENMQPRSPQHDGACDAAKAVEAAGRLAGLEASWAMHTWIVENPRSFSLDAAQRKARELGIDPSRFATLVASPEVAATLTEDIAAPRPLGLRGVPFLFVNGRQVPFWRLKGEPLVERIVEVARGGEAG
ncbi:MAG: thioredoxin domain-containing protein [Phycisphaerales bacterium]|nr:thioredoxin domain-containing protein [Phycisphaerales bacterium]